MKKKVKKTAEDVLKQVMAALGPRAMCCCCDGCQSEMHYALEAVHKYFGKKGVKEIYKEMNYKWDGKGDGWSGK